MDSKNHIELIFGFKIVSTHLMLNSLYSTPCILKRSMKTSSYPQPMNWNEKNLYWRVANAVMTRHSSQEMNYPLKFPRKIVYLQCFPCSSDTAPSLCRTVPHRSHTASTYSLFPEGSQSNHHRTWKEKRGVREWRDIT